MFKRTILIVELMLTGWMAVVASFSSRYRLVRLSTFVNRVHEDIRDFRSSSSENDVASQQSLDTELKNARNVLEENCSTIKNQCPKITDCNPLMRMLACPKAITACETPIKRLINELKQVIPLERQSSMTGNEVGGTGDREVRNSATSRSTLTTHTMKRRRLCRSNYITIEENAKLRLRSMASKISHLKRMLEAV